MSLHTGTFIRRFPESDTTTGITEGAELSNETAAQSHDQPPVKPFGSAAARFKIRSAKTLQRKCEPTTKELRMISNIFEGGKGEDSSQKRYPGKDLNKVCTTSASCINDKKTGNNIMNGTRKDSPCSTNSEKRDVSAKQSNTQEEESKTASDRSIGDDLRRYQPNKSKSLGWRGTVSRAENENRTGMTSGSRDFDNSMTQSGNFERTGENNKITSYTQENQPSGVSSRIHAYSGANQNADRKVYPILGSVRMNRVNLALEHTSSGQSLPVRLKRRLGQRSIGEGSCLWAQQQGESSLDQTDRVGSCSREQEPSKTEEVTGNQTIMERIEKLGLASNIRLGADAKSDAHSKKSVELKHNNTLTSGKSFPKSLDTVDSTPRYRKFTTDSVFGTDSLDIQRGKPYNVYKAKTLPGGFSKTYFSTKQESSTNSESKKVKNVQSLLPEDNEETSRMWFTVSPKYCSQSLERTRSRLSATAQYNACRNEHACSDGSSSISSQGFRHLLTTFKGINEEIGEVKQSDEESTKRLDINENKNLGGLQDGITQPKNPLASKGAAHNENLKEEEKEEVFPDESEGRRGEGVLEKLHVPSFDSVKNTISMFESLAQQSKHTPEMFLTKRALSVQDYPKPVAPIKKSSSDKNIYFGRIVANTESLRTNLFNKSDSNEETEGPLETIVKVRPTLEWQETYKKSVELAPAFKQMNESRTEQGLKRRGEDELTTVNKKEKDELDSAITATSVLRNIRAKEEKAGIPSISYQSNVKSLLKQQTMHLKIDDDDNDDDDENTPTNSPDRAPLTVSMQKQIKPGTITVNGTNPKVLPNLSQCFTPVQTIYSSLNISNNNNYETKSEDFTLLTTNKARWSSDEEDDDEEETETEDFDSGESSVTIRSNMSQSDRRSFSLSLVDLCNYGGVDYKPSDDNLSEDEEDLPCTRSASLSSDISAFSSVTLLSTDELDRLLDDVRGLGDDTLQKYEDVQVVVLHKEEGSGLGFTLAGGVDQNKPVTVHRVIPGGIAAHEGSIYEGARVLSINGTALQNSAHWEALRTLRKARGQGMAVVVLQSGNSRKEANERPGITGRRIRVTLKKSSSDLGFSLEGGVGSSSGDKPLIVQKIFHGGPDNEVFPGDELLEVQGQNLVGMMRLEAWNLIKKLPPGPVEVLLHRPHQPH